MIIDSFERSGEEILTARDITNTVPGFPEMVLSAFSAKTTNLLTSLFPVEQIAASQSGRPIPIWKFEVRGQAMAYYQSPIGGSAAASVLEEVIAMGARKLLFFGSAGSLDQKLTSGHLIVPTAAYRDEGTSYHYAPPSDYIEVKTAARLITILDELKVPFRKAKVWTTDAVYRETREAMERRKAEGCAAVEMESASLTACGDFRGVDVHYLLYAADCLDGAAWDHRILGHMPEDMRERILRIAVEVGTRV